MIVTLGDMRAAIDASEAIPDAKKALLRWALNRTTALIGHGLAEVRADRKIVLRQLDELSPAMAGLSPQSFANLKSLVRAAFRLFAPHLPAARSRIRLKGQWAVLEARLPLRPRRELSRFMRFAQGMGWDPRDIGEEHVQIFDHHLEHEAMLAKAEGVARGTRYAWNRAVDTVPGWPEQRLDPPPCKRSPYWLRLEQLPVSLQQEIADYLRRLGHPDPFLGEGGRNLAPTTIGQVRNTLIVLASALHHAGVPLEDLTSIATLLRPDNVKKSLSFLYERAGGRVTMQMHGIAYRARSMAAHAGLPEPDLARLDEILASVKRACPNMRGLADKNRILLENLDDPAFVDRLVTLPYRLMHAARQMTASRLAASSARDAVAIELLLTCAMRAGNLVDLRIGETVRRFGEGRDARWVVDIPAEKVKNRQPLRYTLLPESGQLIEEYLTTWHHSWCGPGTPWLFPDRQGGHLDRRFLSESIARRAWRYVGVRITAHQFRHLAAELYLREDPNGLGIVSQHLGHRDLNTTRRFYAREQTRIATQRYHEVLTRTRAAVPSRPRRTRKVSGKPA